MRIIYICIALLSTLAVSLSLVFIWPGPLRYQYATYHSAAGDQYVKVDRLTEVTYILGKKGWTRLPKQPPTPDGMRAGEDISSRSAVVRIFLQAVLAGLFGLSGVVLAHKLSIVQQRKKREDDRQSDAGIQSATAEDLVKTVESFERAERLARGGPASGFPFNMTLIEIIFYALMMMMAVACIVDVLER